MTKLLAALAVAALCAAVSAADKPALPACCKALTPACKLCQTAAKAGLTVEAFCKNPPASFTKSVLISLGCPKAEEPKACCLAMNAECLACKAKTTVAIFCQRNKDKDVDGCKKTVVVTKTKCEKPSESCPKAKCTAPPTGCTLEEKPLLFLQADKKTCCPRMCFFVDGKGEQCKPAECADSCHKGVIAFNPKLHCGNKGCGGCKGCVVKPEPKACCEAMNAECLACKAKTTVAIFCQRNKDKDVDGCKKTAETTKKPVVATPACCKALTPACKLCAIAAKAGLTVDAYCKKSPAPLGCKKPVVEDKCATVKCAEGTRCSRGECVKQQMCCRAMTAECLACGKGMSVADYCDARPTTNGCKAKCEKPAESCPQAKCMAPPAGCTLEEKPPLFLQADKKTCCPRMCFFVNGEGEPCKPAAATNCKSSMVKRAFGVAQNTAKVTCAKDAAAKSCAAAKKSEAAAKSGLVKWATACQKDAAEEEKGAKKQDSDEARNCKGKLEYYRNQNATATKYLVACKAKATRPARAASATQVTDVCAKAAIKAKEAAAGIAEVMKACSAVLKVEAGFPVTDDSKREAKDAYNKLRGMLDTCAANDNCEELKAKMEGLSKVRASLDDDEKASLASATALATKAFEAANDRLKQCLIKTRSATSKAKPAAASTTKASRARRAAAAEEKSAAGAKPVRGQTKPSLPPVKAKPAVGAKPVEVECKMACKEGSKCVRGKCMQAFVGVRKDDPCADEVEALTLAKRTLESLKQKAGDKRKESAADKKEGARDVLAFAAKALAKAEAALAGCTDDCELLTQAVAVAKSALVAATAAEATAEGDAVAAAKDALLLAAAEYVYSEGDEGDLPPLVAADTAATDGNSTATDGNSTGTGGEEGFGETTTAAAMNKEDEAKLLLAAAKKAHAEAGCDDSEKAKTDTCKVLSAALARAQAHADAQESSAAAVASTAVAVAAALAVALM